MKYKSDRIIDGKPRRVVVDENGHIINKNPVKEELKGLEKELHKVNRKKPCTEDELLGFMKKFEKENGRAPMILDFNNNSEYPSFAQYIKLFGKWNKAIEMAGLWNSYVKRQLYKDKELLGFMKQFEKENGRVPVLRDFDNNPRYPNYTTYMKVFGSWNKAIELAGLQVSHFTNVGNIVLKTMYYNDTNICHRCGKNFDDIPGNPRKEYTEKGEWTGKWDCKNCYEKYDSNSTRNVIKSVANCRTREQNPDHSTTKGDKSQKLVCELYEYEDLNEKNNNYTSPIDCYDHKKGSFHQVKGKWYDPINRYWGFCNLEDEWNKEYEDMACLCISEDGKMIERMYRIPSNEINKRKTISIVKYDSKGILYEGGWYEQYRVTDLKKANEIWKKIIINNL